MVKLIGEYYFSQLLGKPIYDASGARIAYIRDMAVRWNGAYPEVVGIKYAKKTSLLIPIHWINEYNTQGIHLEPGYAAEKNIALTDNDIFISKWLLDKQIVDLKGSKLVRVNDVRLVWLEQKQTRRLVVIAVDIGIRGLMRRLGLEFLVKNHQENLLGWQYMKPLERWDAHLQVTQEKPQLKDLHPADIADLLEDMSYKHRSGFIQSLNDQQAIDTLSELDLETQVEVIQHMDEERASDILEDMPPDEAADILGELPIKKSEELLKRMENEDAAEVRELMQYEEGIAGALMTTEYITFSSSITAEQAINQLREQAPSAETIYYLYVIDEREHLLGVLSLRELIIADPCVIVKDIMHTKVVTVSDHDDDQHVAEVINKYGLLAVPVVSGAGVMLGIITVDDILDIVMPEPSKIDSYFSFAVRKLAGRRTS